MKLKILLVSLQTNLNTIGLKQLHRYLRINKVDSHILFIPNFDLFAINAFYQFIDKHGYGIIGISCMSYEFPAARKLAACVKTKYRDIDVLVGGVHATIAPAECLEIADYIFRGESEEALLEFLQKRALKESVNSICNLGFKINGKTILNDLRPTIKDLDMIPFPEHFPGNSFILDKNKIVPLSLKYFKKYVSYSSKFYFIKTMRGCPYNCTFCINQYLNDLYQNNKIRSYSVNRVVRELQTIVQKYPDIIYISIEDETFLLHNINWLTEFFRLYKQYVNKHFICLSTPDMATREKLELMKQAGLAWIYIGLQSGSQQINDKIYLRRFAKEKFLKAAELIHEIGIAVRYDVIVDNPWETEEDSIQTIELILSLPKPFQLQIFSLCFYQGTKIREMGIEQGIDFDNPLQKNYFCFDTKNIFNRIIRLCPLLPKGFIRFLLYQRESFFVKIIIYVFYYPMIIFLEPVSWFVLINKSFNNDTVKTITMILSFLKRGISKVIFRRI